MNRVAAGMGISRGASPASEDEKLQFVTFALGSQHYCVDIMSVREIRVSNMITPLPGAPDFVRGVINLRGTIIPIADLRLRFGQGRTEMTSSHAVVIVSIDDRFAGLLVDEVCDIMDVTAREIAVIPATDASQYNPFFQGLITQGDTMLIVIALDGLMNASASHQPGTDRLEAGSKTLHAEVAI